MQQLNFEKTKKLLEEYKLPLVKSILIKSEKQLEKMKVSFPGVLKIYQFDVELKID